MIYEFNGKKPQIDPSVFLTPSSDVIGDVIIQKDSSLWFQVVVRGDVNSIRIGSKTNIQDGSILHVTYKKAALAVGSGVTVGHAVTLHGCTVNDFCLIGMRAVVMDHAEIGAESIVGAGSLVTQNFKAPARSLIMGSPAKVIRALTSEEIAFLHQSADNYVKYVAMYREGGFRG